MSDSSEQDIQGFVIKFHRNDSLRLVGEGSKLAWLQKNEDAKDCSLTFQIDFEQYTRVDITKIFNQEFNIDGKIPTFQRDQAIKLKVSLKSDLLPELTDHAGDLENYLTQLNIESPNHPLFLAENWYLLHATQTTPSGEIIYRTLWDYLNPAILTADNIDTEQVTEAISNYLQDWTENNLADLTTEALDTAFQDLTQDLKTWVDENFTATDVEELTQLFTDLGKSLENLANSDELNNSPFSPPSLLNTVLQFFTQDDWAYTKIQGELTLRLAFQGKSGSWSCYAQVLEDSQKFAFYSLCPTPVPESKRPAIAEFIARANYGMVLGNFELDYSDGEIRYKTSIDVEGDRLTPALVRNLVYTNVMTMDQYLPGIIAIIEGSLSPIDAITQVET